MEIKPIETIYKGIKFRSRLEARWAVFFDACGVEWEYEPEGFKLPDGTCYLPDFKLKNVQTNHASSKLLKELWVEVKGELTESDMNKIIQFSNFKQWDLWKQLYKEGDIDILTFEAFEPVIRPIIVLGDIPRGDSINNFCFEIAHKYDSPFFNFEYIDGDYFNCIPCINTDTGFTLNGFDDNYLDTVNEEATIRAYHKALQARFEHGEKPL